MNFQMFKLVIEKAEESEIRLSHLLGLVERTLSNIDLKKLCQTSSLLIGLKQLSICEHQFPGKP